MGIKAFFKKAFSDMKESTKAQHEVDKANFAAAKAEAKANWEEAKMSPSQRQAKMQEERESQIAAANERKAHRQRENHDRQHKRQRYGKLFHFFFSFLCGDDSLREEGIALKGGQAVINGLFYFVVMHLHPSPPEGRAAFRGHA